MSGVAYIGNDLVCKGNMTAVLIKRIMNNPSAFIHPDAKIGENVVIEPFAYIDKDTEIGNGSWIGPNACIWEGSRIGNNCKIYADF